MARKKLTLEQLISAYDEHRKLKGKVFVHRESGEKFNLIDFQIDTKTQRLRSHYCRVALPHVKFGGPIEDFLADFEESKG